jgi:hypothetical protein
VIRSGAARLFEAPCLLPGEIDAVDHRDIREYGNHPQDRRHAVKERAYQQEHDALGTLEETHLAFGDGVFGARAGIAHHHGAGHHNRGQDHVEIAVNRSVVDQQAHEENQVGITVDDGIEEPAEAGHAAGRAGNWAVGQIKNRRSQHDQAGREKLSAAEKDGRNAVDHEPGERQDIRVNPRERQAAHDFLQQPVAGLSDGVGVRHKRPSIFDFTTFEAPSSAPRLTVCPG